MKSLTRASILLVFATFLAGCDPNQFALHGNGRGDVLLAEEVVITQKALNSPLAIQTQDSRIRVGQNLGSSLIGGFRSPERGVPLHELPPQFASGFRGAGWETSERSVALVGRDDDVILAMETWTNLNVVKRDQILHRYELYYGTPNQVVNSEVGSYEFWDDGAVRLMVCSVRNKSDGFVVTSAVGLVDIMDRLRMSPELAQRDLAAAAEIVRAQDNGN